MSPPHYNVVISWNGQIFDMLYDNDTASQSSCHSTIRTAKQYSVAIVLTSSSLPHQMHIITNWSILPREDIQQYVMNWIQRKKVLSHWRKMNGLRRFRSVICEAQTVGIFRLWKLQETDRQRYLRGSESLVFPRVENINGQTDKVICETQTVGIFWLWKHQRTDT